MHAGELHTAVVCGGSRGEIPRPPPLCPFPGRGPGGAMISTSYGKPYVAKAACTVWRKKETGSKHLPVSFFLFHMPWVQIPLSPFSQGLKAPISPGGEKNTPAVSPRGSCWLRGNQRVPHLLRGGKRAAGVWPSGKASEFGSDMQRFESFHPSRNV